MVKTSFARSQRIWAMKPSGRQVEKDSAACAWYDHKASLNGKPNFAKAKHGQTMQRKPCHGKNIDFKDIFTFAGKTCLLAADHSNSVFLVSKSHV